MTVELQNVSGRTSAYVVHGEPGAWDWAFIYVTPMPSRSGAGGRAMYPLALAVESTFGSWGTFFHDIGRTDWKRFLGTCDFSYLMNRLAGNYGLTFDHQATIDSLREHLIRMRWERDLSKEDARECWEEIRLLEVETGTYERDPFVMTLMNDFGSIIRMLYDGDPCDLPMCSKRDPACEGFWQLWREFWDELERIESI